MSALPSPLSFRRGVALRAGVRLMLFAATATAVSAAELKRRVLVLPFDNTLKNKNYNWMSDSIAQNLKDDLLKSERFEVLDVTLLRKIDPNMKFQNLDAKNASAVAARLNCEVAVVGRFSVRKEGKKEIVTFEADGVDALETQTVVVKNGTVLAVEAFEGTNEAVKRGGALGRGGATMVKVSKPNQDMRFDVPVVGPDTIRTAASAGVDLITVEAGMTLLLGREEVLKLCADLKVSVIAIG